MSKPLPLQHESTYHIYNRGNNRENIFCEERNYTYFMKLYTKYIEPIADTFAYCLLRNHFHLLVRIKIPRVFKTLGVSATPSQQFGHFFNAYAKAFSKAYNRTGSLFQNPFGRVQVTSDAHFTHLVTYIHRNPEHHGLIEDFRDWPHSSFHTILLEKPTQLARQEVLGWYGDRASFITAHQGEADTRTITHLIQDDLLEAAQEPRIATEMS